MFGLSVMDVMVIRKFHAFHYVRENPPNFFFFFWGGGIAGTEDTTKKRLANSAYVFYLFWNKIRMKPEKKCTHNQ